MDAAAVTANKKVLFHPLKPGEVVRSSNEVGNGVLVFHETIGITGSRVALKKKRWTVAAGEARDTVRDTGVAGIQTAAKLGLRGASAVGTFSTEAASTAKDAAGMAKSNVVSKLRRGDTTGRVNADADADADADES